MSPQPIGTTGAVIRSSKQVDAAFRTIPSARSYTEHIPWYQSFHSKHRNRSLKPHSSKGRQPLVLRRNLRSLFQPLTNRRDYTSIHSVLMSCVKFHHDTYCTYLFFFHYQLVIFATYSIQLVLVRGREAVSELFKSSL